MKETETENTEQVVQDSAESNFQLHPDIALFIQESLRVGDYTRLDAIVKDMHIGDLAEYIHQADASERADFIKAVGHLLKPELLLYLEPDVKEEVLRTMGTEESAAAILQLESDDAMHVLEDLEDEEQQEILESIPEAQRQVLEEGLLYPEDSAGRLMNTNFVSVPQQWTVGNTIDFLRTQKELPDDFYQIVITTSKGKPLGGVLVSRVIRSKRDVAIKEIMDKELRQLSVDMDQEEVAYVFQKYGLVSAPVVNREGIMVGVISLDDVVDIIKEEAEEDILRMAGVNEASIFSGFFATSWSRFSWLFVNLLTAISAAFVISQFQDVIAKYVVLAVLMPIIASMSGNGGIQTLAVMVRAIANKEVTGANAFRVLRKEFLVAIFNGIMLAAIVGGLSFLLYQNLELSIIFSGALLMALTLAAIAGVLIPLTFEKLGIDPAIASGVFLTTVTDIASFFIFLGLAFTWLM